MGGKKMESFTRCLLGIAIVYFFSLTGAAHTAELPRIPVGMLTAGEMSPTYIAQKKGFFEKYGLGVDLMYFQGGSQAIQALVAGQIPLTVTAGPEGVVAKLQGADVLLLSTNNTTLAFTLFVSPEIKKPEDLRGKKAGISRFGSSSDHSMRFMLRKLGLGEKEVAIVEVGDNPSRFAALTSNNIQACLFSLPFSAVVKKAGFAAMLEGHKLGLKFHSSGIATSSAVVRQQPRTIDQFFRGFLEGVSYAKSHKDESVALIREFLKLKDKYEAEETYQVFVQEIQPRKPYPLKEAVETVLGIVEKTVPKAKDAKAEDLIDDSVIRKLDQSGFIDGLYK
jgi:NitT/TauT family transport system substrate-binding protein